MRSLIVVAVALLALAAGAQSVPTPTQATNSATPLSDRIVAYTIDSKVDAKKHTVDATETLVWRNTTGQPQDTFPFHLYLNAFRPESTFSREARMGGIRDGAPDWKNPDKVGGIDIKLISVDGQGDLTQAMTFIAPDDGNADDHTVMALKLPKAIAPGESATFRMTFRDKFPESIARNGYKRDFLMGGQWFPKVGVWWHGAWNAHQYHASTEFFADFGTFDVKLNLPQRYMVGTSGIITSDAQQPDGTHTVTARAEDVHDFAWAASPNFHAHDEIFQSSMGPVRMHALMLTVHDDQAQRHLDVLKGTMQKFNDWYGPYPYTQITLIDPEPGSAMEGMEYPTLITAGTSYPMPKWAMFPELVTEHEFGHQYWYGMVATNEFEEAWMDEGINSYTEVAVLGALFGPQSSVFRSPTFHMGDGDLQRFEYVIVKDTDPITRKAWQFESNTSYGGITYGKTATLLKTLEYVVGKGTMDRAMRQYFMTYRFQHPTAVDFLNTVQQVSGRDLSGFYQQAVYGTAVLDYSIKDVDSQPVKWWDSIKLSGDLCRNGCNDTVTVQRLGDFVLPVTVEVRFSDGSSTRVYWDGADRWHRFLFQKKASITSATVDPDNAVPLDADLFNNSYRVDAAPIAGRKLSGYWWFANQLFAQLIAFFA